MAEEERLRRILEELRKELQRQLDELAERITDEVDDIVRTEILRSITTAVAAALEDAARRFAETARMVITEAVQRRLELGAPPVLDQVRLELRYVYVRRKVREDKKVKEVLEPVARIVFDPYAEHVLRTLLSMMGMPNPPLDDLITLGDYIEQDLLGLPVHAYIKRDLLYRRIPPQWRDLAYWFYCIIWYVRRHLDEIGRRLERGEQVVFRPGEPRECPPLPRR